jgi:hypothetical protein
MDSYIQSPSFYKYGATWPKPDPQDGCILQWTYFLIQKKPEIYICNKAGKV